MRRLTVWLTLCALLSGQARLALAQQDELAAARAANLAVRGGLNAATAGTCAIPKRANAFGSIWTTAWPPPVSWRMRAAVFVIEPPCRPRSTSTAPARGASAAKRRSVPSGMDRLMNTSRRGPVCAGAAPAPAAW